MSTVTENWRYGLQLLSSIRSNIYPDYKNSSQFAWYFLGFTEFFLNSKNLQFIPQVKNDN